MAGTPRPYRFFFVMMPMGPDDPMRQAGLDELFSLDRVGVSRPWRRPWNRADGLAFAGEPPDGTSPEIRNLNAAAIAHRHIGLPLMLAVAGAALLGVALPRWRMAGFVVASIGAIAFLASLDLRAVHFAAGILEDKSQPLEMRTRAMDKGFGTFFWRSTLTASLRRVADDRTDDQAFRRYVAGSIL